MRKEIKQKLVNQTYLDMKRCRSRL